MIYFADFVYFAFFFSEDFGISEPAGGAMSAADKLLFDEQTKLKMVKQLTTRQTDDFIRSPMSSFVSGVSIRLAE